MLPVAEIRLINLKRLVEDDGGNKKFAERCGINEAQVSQWLNRSPHSKTKKPRVMSDDSARAIEKAHGLQPNWMDHEHSAESQSTRLDADTLAYALDELGKIQRLARRKLDYIADQAAVLKMIYDEKIAPSGNVEKAVADALELILDRGVKA